MPTKSLPIELIQVLGSVQPRQTLNEDAIEDYAQHYKPTADGNTVLPPLRCFFDGERHILSRGFHRYTAAQRAKRESLDFEIVNGDERAAILDAMADNSEHGVRLTPADKRKAVNRLLDDPEWGKLSQTKIAEMANVSRQFVALLIIERKPKTPPTGTAVNDNIQPSSGGRKRKLGKKGGVESVAEADPMVLERRARDARKKADDAADKPDAEPAPAKAGKPPKKLDRSAYLKEWDKAIGPLVRLVDKIAKGVGESKCEYHKTVQEHLNIATDEMHEWMGKK